MCTVAKTIVLGVTGSIAAYRAADLCSALNKEEGLQCRVAMTRSATRFVGELTFTTLTQNPVITDDNIGDYADRPEHLALGDLADLFVVAPATANIIGKMAHGIADDIVGTTYLSVTCPVVVAPAMNVRMLEHPAVRANLGILRERGVRIVDPEEGVLACGDYGKGKIASTETLLGVIREMLT